MATAATNNNDIYQRRYLVGGDPTDTSETLVNDANGDSDTAPGVAMVDPETFVTVWQAPCSSGGRQRHFQRIFKLTIDRRRRQGDRDGRSGHALPRPHQPLRRRRGRRQGRLRQPRAVVGRDGRSAPACVADRHRGPRRLGRGRHHRHERSPARLVYEPVRRRRHGQSFSSPAAAASTSPARRSPASRASPFGSLLQTRRTWGPPLLR